MLREACNEASYAADLSMSASNVLKSPEAQIEEVLRIGAVARPHHAYNPYFRLAFIQEVPIRVAAEMLMGSMSTSATFASKSQQASGYYRDTIAGSDDGRQLQVNAYEQYFTTLRELPNASGILFDIGGYDNLKDGICTACPVGKHCKATNYTSSHGLVTDVAASEAQVITSLRRDLENQKAEEGTDYASLTTEHTLTDYAGKPLADTTAGTMQHIKFDSLVVAVGAMRQLAEQWIKNDTTQPLCRQLYAQGVHLSSRIEQENTKLFWE